jgi:hypothetical protein
MIPACLIRILTLALVCLPAFSQGIDRRFSYTADLTGDGHNESVVLAIRGVAIDKPFTWSLTVTDQKNHVLYKTEQDDSWIDKFFGEEGYMIQCSTYEQCKRRYYFEDQPHSISGCLKKGGTRHLAKIVGLDNSKEASRHFLKEKKAVSPVIDAALKELPMLLAAEQTMSLCFSYHPNDHGQYLLWIESVGAFVPYYEP